MPIAARLIATILLTAAGLPATAAAQSIPPSSRGPISAAVAALAVTTAPGRLAARQMTKPRRGSPLKRALIGAAVGGGLCYWLNSELEGNMRGNVKAAAVCGGIGAAIAASFR
jgi:hypothetical protein